jgi:hypothetical protein
MDATAARKVLRDDRAVVVKKLDEDFLRANHWFANASPRKLFPQALSAKRA